VIETLRDLEIVRAVPPAPEIRAAAGDGEANDILGTMTGHFSVFDSWYRIDSWFEGTFMESVAPGAFRKTMAERRSQVVVAFDHGYDPVIGDKVLGPIDDLREDGTGAYYEVGLMDTSYNRDLMPGLKRGLYGASFRFQVIKDEWDNEPKPSDYNPDGIPERTIREVRLYEFGPVTYPASPAATAGMRMVGLTDAYYARMQQTNPAAVETLRGRVAQLRTSTTAPAAPALVSVGAAPIQTDEPAERHSGGLSHADRRVALYPYLKG
jgi:HK97 family phage prohead protease